MDNIKLLEYSIKHPEKFMDSAYVFIEKHKDLNSYVKKTKKIKNLLITIKQLKNKRNTNHILNELFNELAQEVKKYANYSELGCFINACDSNIEEASRNINLLKKESKFIS